MVILDLIQKLLSFGFGLSLIGSTSPNIETESWKSAFENMNYGHTCWVKYNRNYFSYGWLQYEGKTYNTQEVRVVKDVIKWTKDTTQIGEIIFGANSYVNQMKQIDYQEVYTTLNVNWKRLTISGGFAELWEELAYPSPCAKIGLDYTWAIKFYINHTTNFTNRRILNLGAMKSWRLREGIVFEIGLQGQQQEECYIAYKTEMKLDLAELLKL